MDLSEVVARFQFAFQKSLGLWLTSWVLRHSAGWDYKLGGTATLFRWGTVLVAYLLAAALPGPGIVRVMFLLIGLAFLCWPNFAYHLNGLFTSRPTTRGRVVSASQTDSGVIVGYAFVFDGETYGGRTLLKNESDLFAEGQSVRIRFDPLNPENSKLVEDRID
jgi:hypothetical protein